MPSPSPIAPSAPDLLDRLPVGLSVYHLDDPGDAASLRLVYGNAAAAEITGLDVEAEVGRRLVEIAPDVAQTGLLEVYAAVADGGEAQDLGRIVYGDERIAEATYHVRAVPLPDRAVGVIFEDVSDREEAVALRDAQAELVRQEAHLRSLLDGIGDVVLVYPLGAEGPEPLLFANQAACDLYGYSPQEMGALTVEDIVAPERVNLASALDELRRERRATFESLHVTRDGRRVPMSTSARLVEVDGRLCVVALCRDDADQRAFRRALARENRGLEQAVAERTNELEAFAEDLKILHEITTQTHVTETDRLDAYLRAGCRMFDLPIGILSSTPVDAETGETLYRLEAVVSPSPELQPGLTIPLREAFCDAVVASGKTVAYADAVDDPVGGANASCQTRGLRAFIGTPVYVDGDLFGTLNFVSPDPRPDGFAAYERDLVEVMAQAIGRQLGIDRVTAERDRTEGWYRSVVDTLQEALLLVDRDGHILQANPAARRHLGLGEGTELDHERWSVVGEDGAPLSEADLPERAAFATGRPVRGRTQGIVQPDGTTYWYTVNATPVDPAGTGVVDYVVLSYNDVTALRARSEAARRSESLLQAVQAASPGGVMAFRAVRNGSGIEDFEWLMVNPVAAQIVGKSPADLVGRRLLDVFPGNRETGLFDAYVGVVETGEPYRTQIDYRHDGLDTTYRVQAAPLDEDADGLHEGFVVSFTDLGAVAA